MTDFDFMGSLKAKSDQLNADDLIGGPIVAQITEARRGSSDQPLILCVSGGHQPWKPSKTSRRLLAACTGSTHTKAIVGRWIGLFRDPDVLWAGRPVGGIRFNGMSGIQRPVTVALAVKRGHKAPHRVEPIEPPASATPVELATVLRNADASIEQADAWAASKGKPLMSGLASDVKAKTAMWLASPRGADALAEIKAMEVVADGGEE